MRRPLESLLDTVSLSCPSGLDLKSAFDGWLPEFFGANVIFLSHLWTLRTDDSDRSGAIPKYPIKRTQEPVPEIALKSLSLKSLVPQEPVPEIATNLVENAIRPTCIGKRTGSSLGIRTPDGAVQ